MSISEEQILQHQLRGERVKASLAEIFEWKVEFGVAHPTIFGKKYWESLNSYQEEAKVVATFDNLVNYLDEEQKIRAVMGKNYLRDIKRRRELNYNLEHQSEMFFDHVV